VFDVVIAGSNLLLMCLYMSSLCATDFYADNPVLSQRYARMLAPSM
jgi:hypothetical protein